MEKYALSGLTEQEAAIRLQKNKKKRTKEYSTKSYRHIIFENVFSLFNVLNTAIAIALIEVGSIKNCLFMLVVIFNTLIGIIQEIRSKRVVDKLSIVNKTKITVIRDGKNRTIDTEELVNDDIIEISSGRQIPNDSVIVSGSCEVNESLLTGESDSITKREGDKLLSGSFVVSGKCLCRVVGVGDCNYADSLLSQIKYVKKSSSETAEVIRRIIVAVSIFIVPCGVLLFYNQYSLVHNTFKEAVESSAAALIGMIPEGLVLLISTVFALGIIRLSKKNVLSKDLYSLETLARTDILCIDKTGTITTGEMCVKGLVPINDCTEEELGRLLGIIAANSEDGNETIKAVRNFCSNGEALTNTIKIPFSSERKWSAVCSEGFGSVIMGSAEMIFKNTDYSALNEDDIKNYRVLALCTSDKIIKDYSLSEDTTLRGYILLSECVRENISETFEYFIEQDVALKIISGDNPLTVEKLCCELTGSGECVDMSKVSDDEIPDAAEKYSIFGRATPLQKKLIVSALKNNGHTVGMVGDGVNDVLALKESDCSVAMRNGSEAARNVSRLVLLDSDFSSLPEVVAEGRRSVNNLQSSAALFLTKTIFSAVMTLIFMFINFQYPFEPIQMTLISALTIGFPSFVLSFLNNRERIKGSFLNKIIRNSVPTATANILSVMIIVIVGSITGFSPVAVSALCTAALAVNGIALIVKVYSPITPLKAFVVTVAAAGFVVAFIFFGDFFGFETMPFQNMLSLLK